jgi:hypothetical protein
MPQSMHAECPRQKFVNTYSQHKGTKKMASCLFFSKLKLTAMASLSVTLSALILIASSVQSHGARRESPEERGSTQHHERKLIPSHIHERLSQALLDDLLPPISANCDAIKNPNTYDTKFNFTFSSSHPTSNWYQPAADIEEYVFLVEMEHESPENPDQAWTMRLGKGGNVYSFVGAFGEAIPPQERDGAAWIDEVWQTVGVNTDLNGKDGYPYFVHQAGTYDGSDHDNLSTPFYSPTIAVYCGGHSCAVAAWGQQAHLPTKFESSIVYISRYTNCNHGVVEITSLIHNLGDHEGYNDGTASHILDHLNVPWAGVRATTLSEILLSSSPSNGRRLRKLEGDSKERNMQLNVQNPIPVFGGNAGGYISDLSKTAGATVFAQEYYHHDEADYNSTQFDLPCGTQRSSIMYSAQELPCTDDDARPVELVLLNRTDAWLCGESKSNTIAYGSRVIICNIQPTVELFTGCIDCDLKFANQQTGGNFLVKGIVHWAFTNQVHFMVDDDVTLNVVKNVFQAGERIHVERYERGVHYDESLALAFVHGRNVKDEGGGKHPQIKKSFIKYGRGGSVARDFIVFVVLIRAVVKACQTFVKRHYVLTDRLHSMQEERLNELSVDVYLDILEPSDFTSSRKITLLASADFEWFTVALDDSERDVCARATLNAGVAEVCHGWTTPREGTSRLLYIRCASESHVGEDFYYFADDDANDGHVRPYICDDAENDRPEVLWLGFFPRGECDALVDSKMHENLCDPDSSEPAYIVEGGSLTPLGVSVSMEEEGAQGFAPPSDDPEPQMSELEPEMSAPELPPDFPMFDP